eukprot:6658236-Prymnesium_polylepis.1
MMSCGVGEAPKHVTSSSIVSSIAAACAKTRTMLSVNLRMAEMASPLNAARRRRAHAPPLSGQGERPATGPPVGDGAGGKLSRHGEAGLRGGTRRTVVEHEEPHERRVALEEALVLYGAAVLPQEREAVEAKAPRVEQQVLQVDRVDGAIVLHQPLGVDAAQRRQHA